MPELSDRQKTLRGISYLLKLLATDGLEDTPEFQHLLGLHEAISSVRYMNPRDDIPQSRGIQELLHLFPDNTFKQMVRCSKANFARLVDFIKDDQVFRNNALFPQMRVEIQLVIVLNRLGCDGGGASVGQ